MDKLLKMRHKNLWRRGAPAGEHDIEGNGNSEYLFHAALKILLLGLIVKEQILSLAVRK